MDARAEETRKAKEKEEENYKRLEEARDRYMATHGGAPTWKVLGKPEGLDLSASTFSADSENTVKTLEAKKYYERQGCVVFFDATEGKASTTIMESHKTPLTDDQFKASFDFSVDLLQFNGAKKIRLTLAKEQFINPDRFIAAMDIIANKTPPMEVTFDDNVKARMAVLFVEDKKTYDKINNHLLEVNAKTVLTLQVNMISNNGDLAKLSSQMESETKLPGNNSAQFKKDMLQKPNPDPLHAGTKIDKAPAEIIESVSKELNDMTDRLKQLEKAEATFKTYIDNGNAMPTDHPHVDFQKYVAEAGKGEETIANFLHQVQAEQADLKMSTGACKDVLEKVKNDLITITTGAGVPTEDQSKQLTDIDAKLKTIQEDLNVRLDKIKPESMETAKVNLNTKLETAATEKVSMKRT